MHDGDVPRAQPEVVIFLLCPGNGVPRVVVGGARGHAWLQLAVRGLVRREQLGRLTAHQRVNNDLR
jgi:hypothetical protein